MATDFDNLGNRRQDGQSAAPLRAWERMEANSIAWLRPRLPRSGSFLPRLGEPQTADGPPLGAADPAGRADPSVVNFVARASAWLKLRPNRVGILEAVCRQVLGDPGFTLVAELPATPGRTEEINQPAAKENARRPHRQQRYVAPEGGALMLQVPIDAWLRSRLLRRSGRLCHHRPARQPHSGRQHDPLSLEHGRLPLSKFRRRPLCRLQRCADRSTPRAHRSALLVERQAPSTAARHSGLPGTARPGHATLQLVEAECRYVPRGFIDGKQRRLYDFGLIVLRRPVVKLAEFMPLKAASDAELTRLTTQGLVTVAGYPSDRPLGTMWQHAEMLKRFTSRRLFYTVDTCPGHSGSPIWMRGAQGPAIIGVHTTGVLDSEGRSYGCVRGAVLAPPGMLNSGVRVTSSMLAALRAPSQARSGPERLLCFR